MIVSKKESEEEVMVVGSFREGKNVFWYDVVVWLRVAAS